jgi:hypothetical protein
MYVRQVEQKMSGWRKLTGRSPNTKWLSQRACNIAATALPGSDPRAAATALGHAPRPTADDGTKASTSAASPSKCKYSPCTASCSTSPHSGTPSGLSVTASDDAASDDEVGCAVSPTSTTEAAAVAGRRCAHGASASIGSTRHLGGARARAQSAPQMGQAGQAPSPGACLSTWRRGAGMLSESTDEGALDDQASSLRRLAASASPALRTESLRRLALASTEAARRSSAGSVEGTHDSRRSSADAAADNSHDADEPLLTPSPLSVDNTPLIGLTEEEERELRKHMLQMHWQATGSSSKELL